MAVLLTLAACAPAGDAPSTRPSDLPGHTEPKPAPTEPDAPAFTEAVLVDSEACTVKVTAVNEDSLFGYTLKVYLENKTELDLMFSIDAVSVNGVMCDPFWAASVSAGKKANEEIRFSNSELEKNGITEVTDIEFILRVYDNNDWTAEHLVEDVFHIYPKGEDAAVPHVREPQPSDTILFSNENCAMIVTGYEPDSIWGYTVHVYLENKTGRTLMFSVDDASVNGFMCDPFWAESVAPGKCANAEIRWSDSSFEENSITQVDEIVLPIRVRDAEQWLEAPFVEDTFTLNP